MDHRRTVQHPDAIAGGYFTWNKASDTMVDLAHKTSQNGLSLADASAYNRRPDQFCFLFTWSMGLTSYQSVLSGTLAKHDGCASCSREVDIGSSSMCIVEVYHAFSSCLLLKE